MILLIFTFIILAAFFDALCDSCISESEFDRSLLRVFGARKTYFVRELSWQNKWKNGKKELGEAFWGSSTFFVWLTDGWHLLKFLRNRFYQVPITIFLCSFLPLSFFITYLIIGIVYGLFFEITYSKLLQWIYKK